MAVLGLGLLILVHETMHERGTLYGGLFTFGMLDQAHLRSRRCYYPFSNLLTPSRTQLNQLSRVPIMRHLYSFCFQPAVQTVHVYSMSSLVLHY
jgi:hypothetical protein